MDRNEALGKLAEDVRNLLREVTEQFISEPGWVGLLFDLGLGREFVAFAESIKEGPAVAKMKQQLEYDQYIFDQDTHLFQAAFSGNALGLADEWNGRVHGDFAVGRDELSHPGNRVLRLAYLQDMYGLMEDDLPFPLYYWRLTEDLPTRRAVYLYFFDVLGRYTESPWQKERIAGARFFILYMIKSLLTEFQIIHPHRIWTDLKKCIPGDLGFKVSLKAERERLELRESQAVLEIKEAAFRNSGHSLRARLGAVSSFFSKSEEAWHKELRRAIQDAGRPHRRLEGHEREYHKAWCGAMLLPETCLALQLWGFSSPDDFWYGWGKEPNKKERFFNYGENDDLDLLAKIPEWLPVAFYAGPLATDADEAGDEYDVYLRFVNQGVRRAVIAPAIVDPQQQKVCRVGDHVVQAIFWEVFVNAVKYGLAEKADPTRRQAFVRLFCGIEDIDGVAWLRFWNYAGKILGDRGWERVIPDSGKGLGMAAGVLHNLKLGEIREQWFVNEQGRQVFAVAIRIEGMALSE